MCTYSCIATYKCKSFTCLEFFHKDYWSAWVIVILLLIFQYLWIPQATLLNFDELIEHLYRYQTINYKIIFDSCYVGDLK